MLTEQDVRDTVEHALEVARERPHAANGGVWQDCLTAADLDDRDKPNARGQQCRDLWWSVFFSVVSRESFESHQPGRQRFSSQDAERVETM